MNNNNATESYRNTREGRLGFVRDYLTCTGRRHSQPTGFLDSDHLQSAAARTDDEAAHAWGDLFRSAADESPAAVTRWDAAMLQLFGSGWGDKVPHYIMDGVQTRYRPGNN